MTEIFENKESNLKLIENLLELDSFIQQKSLEQFECIKIKIENEKFNMLKELKQKVQEMPSVKQLYLFLYQTQLTNAFISHLIAFLNDLTQLKQVSIKLRDNSFSFKQSKKFILYIQLKFYPQSHIECTYINKQVQYRCNQTSINFNTDFSKSVFIKNASTKKMKIIIPKDYPQFYTFMKQCISQEIENLQVVINCRNERLAVCQNIYFEDENQIINYIFNKHDVIHFQIYRNTQDIFDKISINKQINFQYQQKCYSKYQFVFKNKLLLKNQITFIQQQLRDNKFDELNSHFYFENMSQIEFTIQHILPTILIIDGKLIQNRIRFFIKNDENIDEYVLFKMTDNNINKKALSFYFDNFDSMIQAFNILFRVLEQYQLVLHQLILYLNSPKERYYFLGNMDDKSIQNNMKIKECYYFLENMVDKSIQYNIKIFLIQDATNYGLQDIRCLNVPLIEEIQCLEELQIRLKEQEIHIFLNKNLSYLQNNKSKTTFNLILEKQDFYSYYYNGIGRKNDVSLIKNKQYNIMNMSKIITNFEQISFSNFAKSKRLVQFQKFTNDYIKDEIHDGDYDSDLNYQDCDDFGYYIDEENYNDFSYKHKVYYWGPYVYIEYTENVYDKKNISYFYN